MDESTIEVNKIGDILISNSSRKHIKVVVAVPNEGITDAMAYDNRMLLMLHLGIISERSKHESITLDDAIIEFFHFTAGRLLTPAAREALADHALAAGMDYMLMIDDDMLTPVDLFERLYNHNVDVVAPLAFTRNAPHYPVLYNWEEGYDPVMKTNWGFNHFIRNYPENQLVRCDAVGFGSALIKMDVIRRMRKPYFQNANSTGEDVFFCYNAYQQTGAKVYMDTSLKIDHMGSPIIINETYAKHYWATEEKKNIKKEVTEYKKYAESPSV